MTDEFVANFELNNTELTANMNLSDNEHFDAMFKINSQLAVKGEGVINATTSNGVVTVTSTTYTHEQAIASDTWVIEHNLHKRPSVTVVDTAGTIFTAQVDYINDNKCIVYINGATKGFAYLN